MLNGKHLRDLGTSMWKEGRITPFHAVHQGNHKSQVALARDIVAQEGIVGEEEDCDLAEQRRRASSRV